MQFKIILTNSLQTLTINLTMHGELANAMNVWAMNPHWMDGGDTITIEKVD